MTTYTQSGCPFKDDCSYPGHNHSGSMSNTSQDELNHEFATDLSEDALLFYLEAILPEVGASTRAHLASRIAANHSKALQLAVIDARIDEVEKCGWTPAGESYPAYAGRRIAELTTQKQALIDKGGI